jgi:predicted phage terminase large subunit-like protein
MIITFNPSKRSDFIYQRFVINPDPVMDEVLKVNYTDNPYFPDILELERSRSEIRAPTAYKRIWLGEAGNADDVIIDPMWFKYYIVLPQLAYRIMVVDTAQKDKEHNDFTVAAVFGVGVDSKLYLVDLLRLKIKAVELRQRVPAFWNKHQQLNHPLYSQNASFYGALRIAYIEDAVSGTALIQEFLYNFKIPVEGIIRSRDKYTRALDAQPFIESGFVALDANAPYLSDFLLECEAFNATGDYDHDDQVDVLVDGVTKTLVESKPFWEYV